MKIDDEATVIVLEDEQERQEMRRLLWWAESHFKDEVGPMLAGDEADIGQIYGAKDRLLELQEEFRDG